MSSPHEWIDAYFDGALAPEEELSLVNWLRADPENARIFVRAAHDHQTLHDTLLAEAICRSCVTESTALPLPRNNMAVPATGAVQPVVKRVSIRTPRVRILPPTRQSRWKSIATGLALAAGFVAILGLAIFLARPRPEVTVARIVDADPGAFVMGGGRLIPCVPGLSLLAGSSVGTDAQASVDIGYADTTRLRVRPGTALTLQPFSRTGSPAAQPEGKRVSISRGSLTARVAKQPPTHPMVFVTPTVAVKVYGTELAIDAAKDTTRVEVKEGRVQVVRTADQATVEVAGGQFVLAKAKTALKVEQIPSATSPLEKIKERMSNLAMRIDHKEKTKEDEDGRKPPLKTETWTFDCGAAKPAIHYERFLNEDSRHPSLSNVDMGIGLDGGAFGNWYRGNCIRILLDRKDVIARQTASKIESRSDQRGYLRFTWELDDGNQLQLSFAVTDDGHAIYARVDLREPSAARAFDNSLDLQLTCYPGGFGPSYHQPSHRCVQTAKARDEVTQDHAGNEFPSVPVTAGESWVFYADKLARSGSLGLVFVPSEKPTGEVKMSNYGQTTTLHYPPQTTSCRVAFFAYELDRDDAWETFSKMTDQESAALKTMRFWPEEK